MRSVVVVFPRIDVRHDADVPVSLNGRSARHGKVEDWILYKIRTGNGEKALLASAMRCTSSRFFMAPPRPSAASASSLPRRAPIDFSERLRAASRSQRMARRRTTHRANFNRHLVVRTTDTTALHFHDRTDVLESLVEDLHGVLASLLVNVLERSVHDAFGDGTSCRSTSVR